MPKLPWTMLLLFLTCNPVLANNPAPAADLPAPPAQANTQPKRTVSIPIYNPKCHLWIPVSQTYREVPEEDAEAAMQAYLECRYP
jgi:hypothetical protein